MPLMKTYRFKRNKKYSSDCVKGHDYRPNGICLGCGKVHRRKRLRWNQKQNAQSGANAIAEKLNTGAANFEEKLKGVLEKKN